jgi:uncharacterized protein (DUF697 family)/predicted GTPase
MPNFPGEYDTENPPDPVDESRFRALASSTGEFVGQAWGKWIPDDLRAAFDNADRRANLVIAGRSGAGKSALLNTIFGEAVAPEGTGLPVTQRVEKFCSDNLPVTIWDTVGLTVESDVVKVREELQELIRRTRLQDESEHIHLILYCVHTRSNRVFPEELELIRELAAEVPLLVVLTQCYGPRDEQADQLAAVLEGADLPLAQPVIFKVLARKVDIGDGGSIEPFGVAQLVRAVAELLPSAARSAFVASQRLVLDVKVRSAKKIVAAAAAGAGAIGMAPVPLVDAPGIAAVQFAMINRISAVMGLQYKSVNAALQASGILGMLTSLLIGRTAARTLRRLIPIAGDAINAATAAHATFTLGTQYINLCRALLEKFPSGDIPVEHLQTAIASLFNRSSSDHLEPVDHPEPPGTDAPGFEPVPAEDVTHGAKLLADMQRRIAQREQPRV